MLIIMTGSLRIQVSLHPINTNKYDVSMEKVPLGTRIEAQAFMFLLCLNRFLFGGSSLLQQQTQLIHLMGT
jgi:hypothetical protein